MLHNFKLHKMGLACEYRLHSHGGGNVGVNIKQLIVQGRIDGYVDGVVIPINFTHAFQTIGTESGVAACCYTDTQWLLSDCMLVKRERGSKEQSTSWMIGGSKEQKNE